MAKTNSFITLLDAPEFLTTANVTAAIGGVPFIRHQFNWLLAELNGKTEMEARDMLTGYTGVKKINETRAIRLAEMIRLLRTLTPAQIATLPLPALPAVAAKP